MSHPHTCPLSSNIWMYVCSVVVVVLVRPSVCIYTHDAIIKLLLSSYWFFGLQILPSNSSNTYEDSSVTSSAVQVPTLELTNGLLLPPRLFILVMPSSAVKDMDTAVYTSPSNSAVGSSSTAHTIIYIPMNNIGIYVRNLCMYVCMCICVFGLYLKAFIYKLKLQYSIVHYIHT